MTTPAATAKRVCRFGATHRLTGRQATMPTEDEDADTLPMIPIYEKLPPLEEERP